jgi:hypothetical protein
MSNAARLGSKMIVITWIDATQRTYPFEELLCAVWESDGNDKSLNAALQYVHGLQDGHVHTFATDETQWRAKAIAAHRNLTEALSTI